MQNKINIFNIKILTKIFAVILLFFSSFIFYTNAWAIDISNIQSSWIVNATIHKEWTWDIVKDVQTTWFSILKNIKIVLEWILLIYIVYTGAKMIMSMWSDDAELTKAKTQLWYSLVAVVFINVPWTIFNAIYSEDTSKTVWSDASTFTDSWNTNILINLNLFGDWIFTDIISAIEVFIFIIAIYVIIMAGIKMMTSRWRDEKVTEAKWKFLYSLFALIFVWFIEAWKQFAVKWDLHLIAGWNWIFWKMMNIALLFAGPTVIIFLTYAWYIYITATWDEDKSKKAKSIIINTVIGILLLLVMVVFLNDLLTLWDNSNIINN